MATMHAILCDELRISLNLYLVSGIAVQAGTAASWKLSSTLPWRRPYWQWIYEFVPHGLKTALCLV